MKGLEYYLEAGTEILEQTFNVKPEKTRLYLHKSLKPLGFKKDVLGVFYPVDLTAHLVKKELIDLVPTLFHEYHGHGTFFKHSIYGKKVVKDTIKLSKLKGKKSKKLEEKIQEKIKRNEFLVEGSAIFTEYFLMKELNEYEMLEKEVNFFKKNLPEFYEIYQEIIKKEQEIGKYSLWYSFGYPKQ